jgi:hypothetical protein
MKRTILHAAVSGFAIALKERWGVGGEDIEPTDAPAVAPHVC